MNRGDASVRPGWFDSEAIAVDHAAVTDSASFPPRLRLADLPTPLQPLPRLSRLWGGPSLWIKRDDWTGSILSGNKIRKLEFVLARAQASGAETVLTCGGVQSNHCRATAAAAARLGLRCVVHMRVDDPARPPEPDGNHLLCRLLGADVRFVSAEAYRALGPSDEGYWIPEGASDAIGMWGYAAAWDELRERSFAAIIHAVGSGGTTAGLVQGRARRGDACRVIGVPVCDDAAFFRDKVARILAEARADQPELASPAADAADEGALELLDGFQGAGYARNRPEEYELLREVARTEGIVLDPVYTLKAMMGLRALIRDGRFGADDEVCFLHTGGVYGLFPKRAEALA